MTKRLSFEDESKDDRPGLIKLTNLAIVLIGSPQGLIVSSKSVGKAGLEWAQWAAQKTGRTGWILLTTAVVTLVPLVFEITREAQLIEQEKMTINALLAEGKTRQEIAQMGFFSALDPTVLGPEAAS
eukprot:jgi/Undpi1/6182/HiC_scaffold_20.g08666.m1